MPRSRRRKPPSRKTKKQRPLLERRVLPLDSEEWLAQVPEMIRGIHGGGERAKARALAHMAKDRRLTEAANIFLMLNTGIHRYLKEYKTGDREEMVALLMLLRVHNSLITGMELALQGYRQQALALQRDVFECCMLAEWFVHDRTAIRRWSESTSKERMAGEFKQKTLRVALDRLEGIITKSESQRLRIYSYLSEGGAHINLAGLELVMKDGKFFFGPVFDAGWLTEAYEQSSILAWRIASLLLPLFPKASDELKAWTLKQNQHSDRLLGQYAASRRTEELGA